MNQPVTIRSIVKQSDEQVSSEIDGEAVLMSIDDGEYFKIDEIGTRIWQLIESETAVSDLISKIEQEFEVEPEKCEAEVLDFLNDLEEHKLLALTAK